MGCVLAILLLSQYLYHVRSVLHVIAPIGSASMGIMFVHELILEQLARFTALRGMAAFLLALGLSFALTRVLATCQITRMIFSVIGLD